MSTAPEGMKRVALIAGAGPAGLTAAYELLRRTDVKPVVIEASAMVGGIARTYEHHGNRIDLGGHRFFSKSSRVMDWWFNILPLQAAPARDESLDGMDGEVSRGPIEYLCPDCGPQGNGSRSHAPLDPERDDEVMLRRRRLSRIFYRRQFFPYPIRIDLGTARRLGLINTGLIGLSYLRSHLFPLRDETYLDAFFINRFGRRLYQTFFKDYTEKVWGVGCDRIRADWGAQRVKGLSLRHAIAQALRDLFTTEEQKAREERETSLITRFYYPKLGPGQMWETVARHVQACGGELRMRQRVVGIEVSRGDVACAQIRDERTGEVYDAPCDFFFSSMPVRELVAGIDPAPPANVREVADGLVYRDFMTVGLLLRKLWIRQRGRPPVQRVPDNWIYIQEGDVRVGRVQIFNNWSPYMVADPDNTVWIGLEYFLNEGDDLWTWSEERIIEFATEEMERIGFLRREDVLDGCVERMPKAYPAYLGTFDRLDEVRDYALTIPNLFMVGRNGMHRYNNQDHSMLTAMLAVDNIADGRTDGSNLWDVNLETEYHEERKPAPSASGAA